MEWIREQGHVPNGSDGERGEEGVGDGERAVKVVGIFK